MKIKQLWKHRNLPVTSSYALLLIILLSVLVTGVVAQEGGGKDNVEPVFVEDELTAHPLNAKAAAVEVTIPPSKDAFVASNDPNQNFGSDPLLRFGYSATGLGATRPLFKYKIEEYVQAAATISKAQLYIYMTAVRGNTPWGSLLFVHKVTETWDEGNVTWNNSPFYGPEIGRGTLGTVPGWQVIDITNEAKEWVNNPDKNKGVIFIGHELPEEDFERDYYSREATSTGLTPYLYVKIDASADDRAPISNVYHPPKVSWSAADFLVKWDGYDPPNSDGSAGSGILWYDLYYTTDGGGNWKIGRAQVTNTETSVTGAGHLAHVGLYARARDNAGNEGLSPSGSSSIQTWTQIDAEPPQATANPLPEASAHSFTVSWQDSKEQSESGLRYYDVQWRVQDGEWQQLVYDTTAASATFNKGEHGVTYEFRARGVDNVGNEQEWSETQASTTVRLLESYMPFVTSDE